MPLTYRSILAAAITLFALAAEAEDCNALKRELQQRRKAVEAAVDAANKQPQQIDELMDPVGVARAKLEKHCNGQWDMEEQVAWENQEDQKRQAIQTCDLIRTSDPNTPPDGLAPTKAEGAMVNIQRTTMAHDAGRCVGWLVPFGSTLGAGLKQCLASCRQTIQRYVAPPSATCTDALKRAEPVMGKMDELVRRAAAGKVSDVSIEFDALRDKLGRASAGTESCDEAVLADEKARFHLLESKATALNFFAETRQAIQGFHAKKLNAIVVTDKATGCFRALVAIPAKDALLNQDYAQCRAWKTEAESKPRHHGRSGR